MFSAKENRSVPFSALFRLGRNTLSFSAEGTFGPPSGRRRERRWHRDSPGPVRFAADGEEQLAAGKAQVTDPAQALAPLLGQQPALGTCQTSRPSFEVTTRCAPSGAKATL